MSLSRFKEISVYILLDTSYLKSLTKNSDSINSSHLMENLTVNKADVITKLNAIAPAVAEKVEEAKAFNKEAILKEVEYTVSNADGFTTSAATKKITVKSASHLKNLPDQAKRIVNLYSLHAGDTIELDQYEAQELANLVNADISLKDEDATFSASVRRY